MEAVALTDCYWWEKPAANENVRRGNHLVESDTLGNTTTEYVWLGNQRLATINNTGTYYSHNDHLGTPQLMTDSAGVIAWQADYDPFGKATVTTSTITNNLRFPGQYYDSETGNHYNYQRDYDPSLGRYAQSDPIGLDGGINTYAYVENNPLIYIDPFGLNSCGADGGGRFPNEFSGRSIEQACSDHDDCYGDCGKSQSQCDKKLYSDIRNSCRGGSAIACNLASIVYFTGVSLGGEDAFDKAQEDCDDDDCDK